MTGRFSQSRMTTCINSDKPEKWNMRLVLGISTVLGVIGVVAAFGLFYLAERVFHLDRRTPKH